MQVTINSKTNGGWVIIPTPDVLTDKINLLKSLVGTETIIHIKTDKMSCYLCGTEELRAAKQKQLFDKRLPGVCMDIFEAHKAIENNTETFLYAIQAFSTPADVKIVFPDKPFEYKIPKDRWDHLKSTKETC